MNEQLNLFAQSRQEYKIDKPIRIIELFGGIGSQEIPSLWTCLWTYSKNCCERTIDCTCSKGLI